MRHAILVLALCLPPAPAAAGSDAADPVAPEILAAGAAIFERRCSQCHGLDGVNYKGPYLNGILGRAAASVDAWDYSPALRAWGGRWTEENLRDWLTRPQAFLPDNAMNFGGFRNRTEDRDSVIAFLRASPAATGGDAERPAGGAP